MALPKFTFEVSLTAAAAVFIVGAAAVMMFPNPKLQSLSLAKDTSQPTSQLSKGKYVATTTTNGGEKNTSSQSNTTVPVATRDTSTILSSHSGSTSNPPSVNAPSATSVSQGGSSTSSNNDNGNNPSIQATSCGNLTSNATTCTITSSITECYVYSASPWGPEYDIYSNTLTNQGGSKIVYIYPNPDPTQQPQDISECPGDTVPAGILMNAS